MQYSNILAVLESDNRSKKIRKDPVEILRKRLENISTEEQRLDLEISPKLIIKLKFDIAK